MRSLLSCILAALFSANLAHAADSIMKYAVLKQDSIVYRAPSSSAEPLGRYRKDTVLMIYVPARDGWYATHFGNPIKGAAYGWLKGEDLQIQETPPAGSAYEKKGGPSENWIFLTGGYALVSPAEVQSALGIPSVGMKALDLSATFAQRFGTRWIAWLRGGVLSYSGTATNPTGAAISYSASSDYGMLGAGYALMQSKRNLLTADLGIGIGLATGGNTNGTQSISTNSIMTVPTLLKLTFRQNLSESIGLGAEAGYRLESLGQVPILYQPVGVAQQNVNMSLSGAFGGVSAYYLF